MDYTEENSYMRKSQIRPPSRIPSSPGKGLSEITESEGNMRSKPASKLPPPTSFKHRIGPCYAEPDPKQRKTLAERAGEPRSLPAPTPSSRPVIKGTSLLTAGKGITSTNPSFSNFRNNASSTTSSRTPSVSSRNTSNSSFSSSIGPGQSRPNSMYSSRPQTSMAFSQSTSSRPRTALPKPRPATSMANHLEEEEAEAEDQGKQNGMQPLSPISSVQLFQNSTKLQNRKLQNRKLRDQQSTPSVRSPRHINKRRDVSVSTAMQQLSLDQIDYDDENEEHQAISTTVNSQTSVQSQKHYTNDDSGDLWTHNSEKALVLFMESANSLVGPKTPSKIPLRRRPDITPTPTTPFRFSKPSGKKKQFLTKDSNVTGFLGFDIDNRLEKMEAMYSDLIDKVNLSSLERNGLEEAVTVFKARTADLENIHSQLSVSNKLLHSELDEMREKSVILHQKLLAATTSLDDQMRAHHIEMDDTKREYRNEVDKLRRDHTDEIDRLLRLHRDEIHELERRTVLELDSKIRELERANNDKLQEERTRRLLEVQELEGEISKGHQNLDLTLQGKDREINILRGELKDIKGELSRQQEKNLDSMKDFAELRETMQRTDVETSSTIQSLESTVASLRARIHFLESGSKAQSDSFADMEARLQEAVKSAEESKKKLIKEETLRRILFNQVQELKGNIRVMCRVRPLPDNADDEAAQVKYPDIEREAKELEILGKEEKSSLGNISRKTHSFTFDRVFGPDSQNQEVFEEISQLVQSALDGYNVCIFCYGQTGSGKTHTMSSEDGMIPRATHQIYETATNLQEKGWTYTMEGSFVEVYNEEIHDLLGNPKEFDKKKHEIRHDDQKKQTTLTGLRTVTLTSPETVGSILKQAAANRSVAATKSNERSSRSHSVFILKLVGRNSATNETSEGTLNLVDLAGSERLKQSGAEGDRMKETQNINKSLSCLGDVIGALGQGKEGTHIPYRNSKLTYLLQYSLGGNSKTLMFVMASPLEAHLSETLTSLKFATKVHNTHIGTAKKSIKVRERASE
ncbi:putative carboxy-terminal kinesin 2 [Venustampulla echinocandica]|uniref:Putative carboxy-terminal kinesin 2 n=1 Tax=Venustampulla echinocandica TaxID=2656787 RepID=A0A370TGQ4_9HELO|nr:putative carboxy-terminal kinesin 2 [Venustampulla echinocandica]RDL34375.1 putative carboxy-terminal kinesin 2 [Venustampulla echinocandica]